MSITVTFYQFAKRENSTAQPTTSTVNTTVDVLLKEQCTDEQPVLILNSSDPDNYYAYNYCYIPFFDRFYFIEHREVNTGKRLYIYCSEDYLATRKAAILSTTAYVKYSSQVTNNNPDTRLTALATPLVNESYSALTHTIFTETGLPILNLTGVKTSGIYILSDASDIKHLFDDVGWENITSQDTYEVIKEAAMQFFTKDSASRNIRSAFAVPWVLHPNIVGTQQELIIGSYPTGIDGYIVNKTIYTDSVTMAIPWNTNDWRRSGKYSKLIMYIPLFGFQELNPENLINDSQVTLTMIFSYENGDVAYQVEGATSRQIVAVGTTNASAPIGVGSSNVNNTKLTTSVSAASIGLMTANPLIAGLGLAAGLLGVTDALGGSAINGGGLGGFASAGLDPMVHIWCITSAFSMAPATMAASYGYPLDQIRSLTGLTGYCECRDFKLASSAATLSETTKINDMLNNGIFIE